MMPTTPGLPSKCPPFPEVDASEHELNPEGSVSIVDDGEEGRGANTACAIYKGIPSNEASGSKKGLRTETAKER